MHEFLNALSSESVVVVITDESVTAVCACDEQEAISKKPVRAIRRMLPTLHIQVDPLGVVSELGWS